MRKTFCDRCGKECTDKHFFVDRFVAEINFKDFCESCYNEYEEYLDEFFEKFKKEKTRLEGGA